MYRRTLWENIISLSHSLSISLSLDLLKLKAYDQRLVDHTSKQEAEHMQNHLIHACLIVVCICAVSAICRSRGVACEKLVNLIVSNHTCIIQDRYIILIVQLQYTCLFTPRTCHPEEFLKFCALLLISWCRYTQHTDKVMDKMVKQIISNNSIIPQ